MKPAWGKKIPLKNVELLKVRSKGICEYQYSGCIKIASEIDHIKSRARMGSHELHNIAHVCRKCHEKKTKNDPCSINHRTHHWQKEGMGEDNRPVILKNAAGQEFHP